MNEIDYEKRFLKPRKHGLWLSDEEVDILNKYSIPYQDCYQMTELLYYIDRLLEEEDIVELDVLATSLAERNYYQNTNK